MEIDTEQVATGKNEWFHWQLFCVCGIQSDWLYRYGGTKAKIIDITILNLLLVTLYLDRSRVSDVEL